MKSYYQHAADKRRALREILGMKDPDVFPARSGWYPGIVLHGRARVTPRSKMMPRTGVPLVRFHRRAITIPLAERSWTL